MACCGLSNGTRSRVIFAGGNRNLYGSPTPSNVINIYNESGTVITPSPTTISVARYGLAAAGVGNYIYIAGGNTRSADNPENGSNVVDIYNISTDQITTGTSLGTARYNLAAVADNNRVYFIGGRTGTSSVSNAIDIYKSDGTNWNPI
jgi:hypothetical protein